MLKKRNIYEYLPLHVVIPFVASLAIGFVSVKAATVVLRPGMLPSQVRVWQKELPSDIRLEGETLAIDLVSLRDLPVSVKTLDMSALEIKGTTLENSSYMGRSCFSDGEVPPFALFATEVEEVLLPSGVTAIGEGAFAETPLKKIVFPASLVSMGARAFYLCDMLEEADLSLCSVTALPEQGFYGCSSLRNIVLPSCVTSLGKEALMKSGVLKLDLSGVSETGDYACASMDNLEEVTLRAGIRLGEGAFFGDGRLGIMAGMPSGSAPLSLALNGIVELGGEISGEIIGEGAYAGLAAERISLHPSVREVREHAFRNAVNLKTVDVRKLGNAVPGCSPLAFSGVETRNVVLEVAAGEKEVWASAPVWKEFLVSEVSEVSEVTGVDVMIKIIMDPGGVLRINSNHAIDEVTVCRMDGIILAQARPGTQEYVSEPFSGEKIVVRVVSGSVSKVVKLIEGY